MYFTKIATQFQNLDVLQRTFESYGFWGITRNTPAIDFFGQPVGVYPLVVPKQGELHADVYAVEDANGYSLYADSMDQWYLESLAISQRYAELIVQRLLSQHRVHVENIISDDGKIYYQLSPISLAINVVISIDGKVSLDIYDVEGNEFSFITALEHGNDTPCSKEVEAYETATGREYLAGTWH